MIYAVFKINDVQGRAIDMTDLLNIELRSDSLNMFDHAWADTLMAMKKGPERASFRWHLLLTLGKEDSREASHSDQVHRKEPKSCLKLKAIVTGMLKEQQQNSLREDQQQEAFLAQKETGREKLGNPRRRNERRLQEVDIIRLVLKRRNMCIQAR